MKLEIELVPSSTWGINLRKVLPKAEWDKIRKAVYKRSNNHCEICNATGRMDAHEIWIYDDKNRIQKLEGVICLCKKCHDVKHFGFSELKGKRDSCIKHMKKVNKISLPEVISHISEKQKEWNEREGHEYQVDITSLPDILKSLKIEVKKNGKKET